MARIFDGWGGVVAIGEREVFGKALFTLLAVRLYDGELREYLELCNRWDYLPGEARMALRLSQKLAIGATYRGRIVALDFDDFAVRIEPTAPILQPRERHAARQS